MTVDHQQISLLNSMTRIALKKGNSTALFAATLQLCRQDQLKAKQLSQWFLDVGNRCKESQGKITEDQLLMRMWMLGNVDIKFVSEDAKPVFLLTSKGADKVRHSPKERLWHKLLWDYDRVVRNKECVIS